MNNGDDRIDNYQGSNLRTLCTLSLNSQQTFERDIFIPVYKITKWSSVIKWTQILLSLNPCSLHWATLSLSGYHGRKRCVWTGMFWNDLAMLRSIHWAFTLFQTLAILPFCKWGNGDTGRLIFMRTHIKLVIEPGYVSQRSDSSATLPPWHCVAIRVIILSGTRRSSQPL